MRKRRMGRVAGHFIRWYGRMLEIRVHDHCGFLTEPPDGPVIHVLWHDSVFIFGVVCERFYPGRSGAILTSASKDGEAVTGAAEVFHAAAVRGSSSRGGAAALIALKRWLMSGEDIAITPDGPRGPRRKLQPGLVILAQKTGALLMPYRVAYDRPWKFKTWDQFQLPRPFSRIDLHLGPYLSIEKTDSKEGFERERLRVEEAMGEVQVARS